MAKQHADRFGGRRDRLAHACRSASADAFLVSNPINVSYLTGFSGEDAYLLVMPGKALLLTDARFTEQLQEECPGLELYVRKRGQRMPEAVASQLKRLRVASVAFESTALTVADWETMKEHTPRVAWVARAGAVEALREIKDAHEIQEIRQAIAIAERAFDMFRASLRPSDDEKTLADAMDSYVRRAGGTASAFPPIIATGPRSALPHAPPTSRRCQESDFLLIDWGAKGEFYHSDLTRILVTRKISAKLARVYDVVEQAQLRAIQAIRPGATGEGIDAIARTHIAESGFGRFAHSLGHGLGMQVHEAPALRPRCTIALKPGMVVTVEPGIYIKGWGGVRLEDDVLVTPDGCEVLTHVTRNLEELVVA